MRRASVPDIDPMDDRAVAGSANPTAVVLETWRDGDDAVAEVWYGPAFIGAPGRVHGGMVAAVFDDVTGFVLADVREPGFTGRLEVSYRAPVPIETPMSSGPGCAAARAARWSSRARPGSPVACSPPPRRCSSSSTPTISPPMP